MSKEKLDFSTALIGTAIGQAVLVVTVWLLPVWSEYGWRNDSINELTQGRFGTVQTVALLMAGLGVLTLTFALAAATRRTWGSTVGPALLGVYGIALLARAGSAVAIAAAIVGFLAAVAAMVVLTWTFAGRAEWRGFVVWSALLATAGFSLLFAQSVGAPWAGLTERVLLTVIAIWVTSTAMWVRRLAMRREPAGVAAL